MSRLVEIPIAAHDHILLYRVLDVLFQNDKIFKINLNSNAFESISRAFGISNECIISFTIDFFGRPVIIHRSTDLRIGEMKIHEGEDNE